MTLSKSIDDGGSPITLYKLYHDAGDDFTSSYTILGGYDGVSTTYVATTATDLLVTGTIYRFVYVATNSYGDSVYSNPLIAGFGA